MVSWGGLSTTVTISGLAFDMLKSVDMLSDEMEDQFWFLRQNQAMSVGIEARISGAADRGRPLGEEDEKLQERAEIGLKALQAGGAQQAVRLCPARCCGKSTWPGAATLPPTSTTGPVLWLSGPEEGVLSQNKVGEKGDTEGAAVVWSRQTPLTRIRPGNWPPRFRTDFEEGPLTCDEEDADRCQELLDQIKALPFHLHRGDDLDHGVRESL